MPYLKLTDKVQVQQDFKKAHQPGELNFLLTLMLIEGWKVAPEYATLHKMYKDFVLSPEKNSALMQFYNSLENSHVSRSDVFTAAALAFYEFYRRIGQLYETIKILENGDVYDEIAKPLTQQLNETVERQKKPLPLIVPTGR